MRNPNRKMDDLYRDDFNTKRKPYYWLVFYNQLLFLVQKDLQQKPGDSEPTTLEEMAKQRDYKRRRQTYRAKNVHITKRSTVEVNRLNYI